MIHHYVENQEMLEKHCQKMCQLNETRGFDERYLIMISIDHPNAGVRKVYDEEEFPTPGSFKHQDLAFKMYLHAKLTAQTISCIIECFDFYAFGLESNLFVEEWGIIGHSMGGMTAGFLPTYGECLKF
jgi:hypothetical protein